MKLSDIAVFITEKVSSSDITISQYVTTDSMLQNKGGRTVATNLPLSPCNLTAFHKSDILLSNIRPYLKKIWFADLDGGCSADVLVLRTKEKHPAEFLYALLMQDAFFDYVMQAVKGSKMPRGNKDHIMEFKIPTFSSSTEGFIGSVLQNIVRKIQNSISINHNLEAMAKQLYDYWFVQFDFPDENGRPYKSSGGKMVWNEKLKREIPEGWHCGCLLDIAEYTNGIACQKYRPLKEHTALPVIKIKEMHEGFSTETEFVSLDIPESVKVYDGDILFSWSASLEIKMWANGKGGLNQHIFKVTSKNSFPKSFYYYQLSDYIVYFKKIAESRKTTMGHITQDHLKQSKIVLPLDMRLPNFLDEKIAPIFDRIIINSQEISELTKLRDQLLPLLINGQVSVENLE